MSYQSKAWGLGTPALGQHSKSLNLAFNIKPPEDANVEVKNENHWGEGFFLTLIIIQYKLGNFKYRRKKKKIL